MSTFTVSQPLSRKDEHLSVGTLEPRVSRSPRRTARRSRRRSQSCLSIGSHREIRTPLMPRVHLFPGDLVPVGMCARTATAVRDFATRRRFFDIVAIKMPQARALGKLWPASLVHPNASALPDSVLIHIRLQPRCPYGPALRESWIPPPRLLPTALRIDAGPTASP